VAAAGTGTMGIRTNLAGGGFSGPGRRWLGITDLMAGTQPLPGGASKGNAETVTDFSNPPPSRLGAVLAAGRVTDFSNPRVSTGTNPPSASQRLE
jgi:hypothetical protein